MHNHVYIDRWSSVVCACYRNRCLVLNIGKNMCVSVYSIVADHNTGIYNTSILHVCMYNEQTTVLAKYHVMSMHLKYNNG